MSEELLLRALGRLAVDSPYFVVIILLLVRIARYLGSRVKTQVGQMRSDLRRLANGVETLSKLEQQQHNRGEQQEERIRALEKASGVPTHIIALPTPVGWSLEDEPEPEPEPEDTAYSIIFPKRRRSKRPEG